MLDELNVKISGSPDDIRAFIDLLCYAFDGRVLSSRLRLNERDPGYHTYCLLRMSDLRSEFKRGIPK